ncbi:MAG: hypothetical protein ACNA8H_12875 [Anaerolineales bacterium]
MRSSSATVIEVRSDYLGQPGALLASPEKLIPAPGQYVLACDDDCLLPHPLFSTAAAPQGFLAAPPIPAAWKAGTTLDLRGPLGRGFQLRENIRHLMLAALGNTVERILPLGILALKQEAAVTLFADPPLPSLPPEIEAYPTSLIPESLHWADFLVIDIPIERLPLWRQNFGISSDEPLPCAGQALVVSPMPCGGMAECGVCAIPFRRTWKTCCKDGPVFNLEDL